MSGSEWIITHCTPLVVVISFQHFHEIAWPKQPVEIGGPVFLVVSVEEGTLAGKAEHFQNILVTVLFHPGPDGTFSGVIQQADFG